MRRTGSGRKADRPRRCGQAASRPICRVRAVPGSSSLPRPVNEYSTRGGDFSEIVPAHEPGGFQFPQALGQHDVCDADDAPFQLIVTDGSASNRCQSTGSFHLPPIRFSAWMIGHGTVYTFAPGSSVLYPGTPLSAHGNDLPIDFLKKHHIIKQCKAEKNCVLCFFAAVSQYSGCIRRSPGPKMQGERHDVLCHQRKPEKNPQHRKPS